MPPQTPLERIENPGTLGEKIGINATIGVGAALLTFVGTKVGLSDIETKSVAQGVVELGGSAITGLISLGGFVIAGMSTYRYARGDRRVFVPMDRQE